MFRGYVVTKKLLVVLPYSVCVFGRHAKLTFGVCDDVSQFCLVILGSSGCGSVLYPGVGRRALCIVM